MNKLIAPMICLLSICLCGCQNDEPKNELYGTKWMATTWFYGETESWYEVYEFTGNNTCSYYYQSASGVIKMRKDNIKYTYKNPIVYFLDNDGNVAYEKIVEGNSMRSNTIFGTTFYKQ